MFPSHPINITGFLKNIQSLAVMHSNSRVHQKVKVEFLFVESETAETELIKTSETSLFVLFLFFAVCLQIYIFIFLSSLTSIEKKITKWE